MSTTQPAAENKMGTMPINKLLLNMGIPMVISMVVQALYNVVDSVFVSKISVDALNAVSLAFPAQNLMISVAVGTGVGINAQLSKGLGEKNQKKANDTAVNGLFLAFLSMLAFAVLGVTCSHIFYTIQTDIAPIVDYGTDYLMICTGLSFGLFAQITLERVLQSTGRTLLTMFAQALGALVNIVLDPILIFGLFGLPRLEVAGAAIATVIGQCSAALLALFFNLKLNSDVQLSLRGFRPNGSIIRGIYSVGVPSIIMSSISSVMIFGMNQILLVFTSAATAVLGIYFKLQSFVFFPIFGLNNGMVPIVAYNFGARNPERIVKTIKLSIAYAMGIMLVGMSIFHLFPDVLINLFKAEGETSTELVDIGRHALRVVSISYVFAGFCVICGTVFQALGHGVLSLIVSVVRQLVVLLPAAFVLSRIAGLDAVWWSFPIAEIFSVIFSATFLIRVYRKEISCMFREQRSE